MTKIDLEKIEKNIDGCTTRTDLANKIGISKQLLDSFVNSHNRKAAREEQQKLKISSKIFLEYVE